MSRRIVTSIRGAIGPAEIERLPIHGRRELRVYYPYHWLVFRAPGRSCHCLVDARTGLVATADPFPTETCEVPEDDVLDATVGGDEARKRARQYFARTRYRVGNGKVVENGVVYKPFWILLFSTPSSQHLRLLMDGITGCVHPLSVPHVIGARSRLAEAVSPVP